MNAIPFAPFEPDRSDYAAAASRNVVNVLPIADGHGPMPSPQVISAALPSAPKGAVLTRTSGGTYKIYAGTATKLYQLNTSTSPYSWTDVSRSVGGDYSVPNSDRWDFEAYGSSLVAVNYGDVPQFIDINAGTNFGAIAGNPPQGKYVWTAGDHLCIGYTTTSPNEIRWSAINNMTKWLSGQEGSSQQTFQDGNEVMGGITTANGAYVFQRDAIRIMQANQDVSSAFNISVVNPSRGVIAPYSVINIGSGQFIYQSEQGFFMGAEARPIGANRVDAWFLGTGGSASAVDKTYLADTVGQIDPFNKVAWLQFRRVDGMRGMLGYNWQLDRWTYSDQNFSELAGLATVGLTIGGAALIWPTIGDAGPITIGDRLFKGGRPTLCGFDSQNRLCVFSGAPLEATIDTADLLLADVKSSPQELRIITDAPAYTVTQGTKLRHTDPTTWGTPVSPGARSGVVNFRTSALLHKFRVSIPAGTDWRTATGILPERVTQDGRL